MPHYSLQVREVPETVKKVLEIDFAKQKNSSEQEEILFCEPPTFTDGLKAFMFSCACNLIGGMLLGLGLIVVLVVGLSFGWNSGLASSPVALIMFAFGARLGVKESKFHFFGYKIITNHRVALVMPAMWFVESTVVSLYFEPHVRQFIASHARGSCIEEQFLSVFHQIGSPRGFVYFYTKTGRSKGRICLCVETKLFEDTIKEVLAKLVKEESIPTHFQLHRTSKPIAESSIRSLRKLVLLGAMAVAVFIYLLMGISVVLIMLLLYTYPILCMVKRLQHLIRSINNNKCHQLICFDYYSTETDFQRISKLTDIIWFA